MFWRKSAGVFLGKRYNPIRTINEYRQILQKQMERYTILWINDTQVVVHTIPDCRAFALSASGAYVAYWREEDSSPVVLPFEAIAEGGARQPFQIN